MTKSEAKKRIENLKKVINHHRYLYHVLDRQEISDGALDALKKELADLENQFPDLVTSDSPTQRVGGKPLDKFEKFVHQTPMLSLGDAFSEGDMRDWFGRISKLLSAKEKKELDFYCELKIDGLAIELVYENRILKNGSTRGDGKIGEDVTKNLKTIEAIPLKIKSRSFLTVRGEVFMSKKTFLDYKDHYANPRNLVAGSIRQLDSRITAKRKLDSFVYEVIDDSIETHEKKHKMLKKIGFKTNEYNKYCRDLEAVFRFKERVERIRDKIPYEIDGVVVIVNSTRLFNKLGVVGKTPRGAIAFKFPATEVATRLTDISISVGRTGALTPVAHLDPVNVGGVVVKRATLHNADEIKRLGVKIGDTVIVERAGDVIPSITGIIKELRTGREKVFKMPSVCPICGSKIRRPKGEVVARCAAGNCLAKQKKNFNHFVSKSAFDIDGLGPRVSAKLLESGLVATPADIFRLSNEDLMGLEGFKNKSAGNLIGAIGAKKIIDLNRLIYALGIRNVGEETAIDLAQKFGDIVKLEKASWEDLDSVSDIGPVVAKSIYEWFRDPKNKQYLKDLLSFVRVKKSGRKSSKLDGKIFVLTGSLDSLTRDDAKKLIREKGGQISSSISSATDYLVAGQSPGSKLEKAYNLGTKVLTEKQFLKLIK